MMPILGAGRVGFYIVANRPGVRLLAGRPGPSTFTNGKPNPSAWMIKPRVAEMNKPSVRADS